MAIGDSVKAIVKVSRKTYFNPRAWLGYDYLKFQTLFLSSYIKAVFAKPIPAIEETFEEAMQRLNLTESDIQTTMQNFFIYSIVFLSLGIATLLFSFYLLISDSAILGWILGMAITSLLLTQAFRYHFWYFQMKFRKLGCTYAEWWQGKPFDQEGLS